MYNNPSEGKTRYRNVWKTRLGATCYLAAIFMFVAPLNPTHSPELNSAAVAEITPAEINPREYAKAVALRDYDWGDKQFSCLNKLWGKESAWNPAADNPKSSAFGIAQMLRETATDAETQILKGLRYIQHRYETPCAAWEFWQRNNWY